MDRKLIFELGNKNLLSTWEINLIIPTVSRAKKTKLTASKIRKLSRCFEIFRSWQNYQPKQLIRITD